jgi:two-component system sensor histidine kinase DegS
VKIEFQLKRLFVVVKDDGCGFSLEDVKNRNQSFGIIGMRERTQILQGTMEITSAPQRGTKVMFQFPLNVQTLK